MKYFFKKLYIINMVYHCVLCNCDMKKIGSHLISKNHLKKEVQNVINDVLKMLERDDITNYEKVVRKEQIILDYTIMNSNEKNKRIILNYYPTIADATISLLYKGSKNDDFDIFYASLAVDVIKFQI